MAKKLIVTTERLTDREDGGHWITAEVEDFNGGMLAKVTAPIVEGATFDMERAVVRAAVEDAFAKEGSRRAGAARLTRTGHEIGVIYEDTCWGGAYLVLGETESGEVEVEQVVKGPGGKHYIVGDRWTHRTNLDHCSRKIGYAEQPVEGWRPELEDAAEHLITALLEILPVRGSWNSGYVVEGQVSAQVVAAPEQWATAALHLCDLHRALLASRPNPQLGQGPSAYQQGRLVEIAARLELKADSAHHEDQAVFNDDAAFLRLLASTQPQPDQAPEGAQLVDALLILLADEGPLGDLLLRDREPAIDDRVQALFDRKLIENRRDCCDEVETHATDAGVDLVRAALLAAVQDPSPTDVGEGGREPETAHRFVQVDDLDPREIEVCCRCGAQRDKDGPLGERATVTGGWPSAIDCDLHALLLNPDAAFAKLPAEVQKEYLDAQDSVLVARGFKPASPKSEQPPEPERHTLDRVTGEEPGDDRG